MDVSLLVDSLAPRMSGIGRYCWELCQRIPHQPHVSAMHYYRNGHFVADPARLLEDQFKLRRAVGTKLIPRPWLRTFSHKRLNRTLVHSPNYFLPKEAGWGITTVHDLSVLKYPETHPQKRVAHFAREFATSTAKAVHIITDTETMRQEVIDYLGIPPDNVSAIWLASAPGYQPRPAEAVQPYLSGLGLTYGSYGLSVSTLEPRKRIDALIRAWSRLPPAIRGRFPLVLAGSMGWLNDELSPQIEQGQAAGWLRHLGFVTEDHLPLLYSGAAIFAYPSLYEGFGLPLLEAMASGVPAIASNRSCMPEVCGDAPLYVEPDDDDAMLHAVERAFTDELWRVRARESGLRRAKDFDWERCAQQTAAVYWKVWRER